MGDDEPIKVDRAGLFKSMYEAAMHERNVECNKLAAALGVGRVGRSLEELVDLAIATLRRDAADQLSREGQDMRLDEGKPEIDWHSAYVSVVGRAARAKYLEAELAETRTAMDAFHRSAAAMRRDRDRLSAGLRGMAARLTRERREATYWASGDWQAENRKLRAELAELRAGRVSGREALVDALDGALVELKRLRFSVKHIPYPEELDEEIDRVQAVLLANPGHSPVFAAPASDTPVPEQFCAHHGDHNYFDRTMCAPPCDEMHTRCRECHKPLDPCAHSAPPSGQPEAVEPNVDLPTSPSVVENFDKDEVREWLADAESRRDVPGPVDDPERIAEQIRELRATEFAEDHVPHTRQTLERLAKHLCERYDANQLTWESADGRDRRHWRREASFALDVLGRNGQ